jgi:Transposase DDE domain
MKGGAATGLSPLDRGKTGSKHHVIVEAHGIPLATILTGGNRNDVTQLLPLIEAVPPIRGKRGRARRRPRHLYAGRGFDHEADRDRVRAVQITRTSPGAAPNTAPASASTAGSRKERSLCCTGSAAWRIRWEIRDDIHQAFVTLGCAIICWRRLRASVGSVAA